MTTSHGAYLPPPEGRCARRRRRPRVSPVILVPVVLLAAIGIPWASGSLWEAFRTPIALAEGLAQIDLSRVGSLEELRAEIRRRLTEEQIAQLKETYFSGRSLEEVEHEIHLAAHAVAGPGQVTLPTRFRALLHEQLTPDELRKVRRWFQRFRPSVGSLQRFARQECAAEFEVLETEYVAIHGGDAGR